MELFLIILAALIVFSILLVIFRVLMPVIAIGAMGAVLYYNGINEMTITLAIMALVILFWKPNGPRPM